MRILKEIIDSKREREGVKILILKEIIDSKREREGGGWRIWKEVVVGILYVILRCYLRHLVGKILTILAEEIYQ